MRKCIIILVIVAAVYFISWLFFAWPYRAIPALESDHLIDFSISRGHLMLAQIARHRQPVLPVSLMLVRMGLSLLGDHSLSFLLIYTLLSNAVVLVVLGIIIFMVTCNAAASVTGAVLYTTSAWPANYCFFWTYAPFAAGLALSALFFMFKAYFSGKRKHGFAVFSGSLCGLYFWSSSSSIIFTGIYFLLAVFLFWPLSQDGNRKIIKAFIASWVITAGPFFITAFPEYIAGINANIESYRSIGGLTGIQGLASPFFSFFRMLGVYNPLLSPSFFLIFLLYILTFRKSAAFSKASNKIIIALITVVLMHGILTDISPNTKLGRGHFVAYPVFIILFISMGYYLIMRLRGRLRIYCGIIGCLLCGLIILFNVRLCKEMIRVKQLAPVYLSSLMPSRQLYLLEEGGEDESHTDRIASWLEDFAIPRIRKGQINEVVHGTKKGGLLISPRGEGSGLSILSNCCLNDFFIDLNDYEGLRGLKKITLPYFAYFPPFLFEEETCQALYFRGRMVDYRSPEKNITLLLWGDDDKN